MADQVTPEQELDAVAEVAKLREENLRLRDLLIGKDAELGSLKGQLAALEAGTGRLVALVATIRGLLPGFVWSALGKVRRRLQG